MKRNNIQGKTINGLAIRQSAIVLLVLFGALAGQGAMAVTWLHHKMTATGSWSGGDPIHGFPSFSQTVNVDTASPAYFQYSAGLPVQVNFDIVDTVEDNPPGLPDLLSMRAAFYYSPGLNVNGSGLDPSTHDFRFTRTCEMVFSTGGCTLFKLDYTPPPGIVATVVIEKGTYSNGVFTPTNQVMDFVAESSATIGPGTYRIKNVYDTGTFSSNLTFSRFNNNSLNMLFLNEVQNQQPVAVDDFYGVDQLSALNEAAPGILVNDTDPDNDTLSVSLVDGPALAASFQLNPDGSFTYVPLATYYGPDTFTYRVYDGAAYSEPATVHITVRQPGSQGFITGGGKFFQSSSKCTFGFVAKLVGSGVQGNLEFQDHDAGLNVKSENVEWVYAPNQLDGYFRGACSINGVLGYSYFVEVHDRGEPGVNDDFTIWVLDSLGMPAYASNGVLSGGNIKIHGQ